MCRQKPSSTNMSSRSTGTMNSQQAPVCESPLFGIRRQLTSSNRDLAAETATSDHQKQHSAASINGDGNRSQSRDLDLGDTAPLSSVPQQISRQQIHYAFSMMDNNKDGMIDVRELSQMLANLGVPIDEAILSHIMSSVSKKGDRKISEEEFVQWISLVIQVNDQPTTTNLRTSQPEARSSSGKSNSRNHSPKSSSRARTTSGSGSSCLVAQPSDVVPRNRRGSGSGLALMRSLSGSSLTGDKNNNNSDSKSNTVSTAGTEPSRTTGDKSRQDPASNSSDQDLEARNDLRAAFCVFDLDGDGYITLDEVREGLKLLGESWSPNELRQLFSKCKSSPSPGTDLSKQRINIDDFVRLLL